MAESRPIESRPIEPLVDCASLGCFYRRGGVAVEALLSATCRIFPGDRIALTGPSGSGKSTLLHLMGGLERPSNGAIDWPALGPVEGLRPAKIAFVFQTPSLLASLTVVENVELPLRLRRVGPDARNAAMAALDRLGLSAFAERLPEELSGGQVQRVAMARAIATAPRLILADEPTGQLDRNTGQLLIDALLGALGGTDTALVIATHDLRVAERMNRVWQMRHGFLDVPQDADAAA